MKRAWYVVLLGAVAVGGWALAQPGSQIVIGLQAEPVTLDVAQLSDYNSSRTAMPMFEGLVRFADGSTDLEPALAERWEVSEDGLTYTFYLRPGVVFHDGTPVNAEAVEFSFLRQLDPDHPYHDTGQFPYAEFTLGTIADIEVHDELTLRITLSDTFAPFLSNLAMHAAAVVSPSAVMAFGSDFSENPVGSGPYRFVRWVRDQEVVLSAFDDYWYGTPSIQEIVFRPIPESSSRVAELVTGGVDVITNLSPEAVPLVSGSGQAVAATVPSIRNIFIVLNVTGEGPLDDPRVRLALNHAVDKEQIIRTILGGDGVANGCPLNPYMYGYVEDLCAPIPYDPERARELLAEAGYADGFTFTMGSPDGRYLNDRQVAEAVVGQLAAVGVRAELRVQEWSSYVGQVLERSIPTDAWLIGWGNSQFDADNTMFSLLYGGTIEGGAPRSVFTYLYDATLDALLAEARATVDQERRAELYADGLALVRDAAPWIFLYQQVDIYGVGTRVDWEPRPDELIWAFDAALR